VPEGHKTHFIARQQSLLLAGKKLHVTSPQGRFAIDAARVDNKTLERVVAAGKHLFYLFEEELIVHVHLGRYGSYREQLGMPEPRGLVRMRLFDGSVTIDLNGPTQCRVISPAQQAEIIAKLGPDPLAGGDWKQAWDSIRVSRLPIGALLLDQTVIAGVGNIFRAELLFEAKLNPQTRGCDLAEKDFRQLWKVLLRMMKVGLKYGKIVTVTASEAGKPLAMLVSKECVRIYGKNFCPNCGGEIGTMVVAARKLYVCWACQDLSSCASLM
jgi:endonuclease VIII